MGFLARNGNESAEEGTSTTTRRNKKLEIKRIDLQSLDWAKGALCVQGITNSEFAEIMLHQNLGIATDGDRNRSSEARTTFVSRTFPSTAGILTTANLQTGKIAYLTSSIWIDQTKKKELKILTLTYISLILKFDLAKFLPLDWCFDLCLADQMRSQSLFHGEFP